MFEVSWELVIGRGRGRRTSRFSVGRAEVRSYEPISERYQLERKERVFLQTQYCGKIIRRRTRNKYRKIKEKEKRCEERGKSREKVADDQIRLCAHMMPVSDVELPKVLYGFFCVFFGFFGGGVLLPRLDLLFSFFFLIYHWSIYYFTKPNVNFELFI